MDFIQEFVKGAGDAKAISAVLGVSVIGLFAVVRKTRRAIVEVAEAVETIKKMMRRYESKFKTDPEIQRDYRELERECDEALEAVADVMERVPFLRKHARRFRAAL